MYVILSLQLFASIRELLTDKFQLIHKVCFYCFRFYFHCVEIIFIVLAFSLMVLQWGQSNHEHLIFVCTFFMRACPLAMSFPLQNAINITLCHKKSLYFLVENKIYPNMSCSRCKCLYCNYIHRCTSHIQRTKFQEEIHVNGFCYKQSRLFDNFHANWTENLKKVHWR